MKLKRYTGKEIQELRRSLRLNQLEFWSAILVTQSAGSRYESGREMPDQVQILLNIALSTDTRTNAIVEELRLLRKGGRNSQR
jgi:DNA-binding transcriptional regulator YiaG